MKPSFDALRAIMPRAPDAWLTALTRLDERWGVNNVERWAAFIGQLAHESEQFTRLEENMNYKAARLCAVWPKRFPNEETAKPYARNSEKLANKVYAGRMGNGDEKSGDGWRFHGRGPIQLTGKDNYGAASAAIGVDLIAQPHRLLEPALGLAVAGWYWQGRGCNALADAEDWPAITRRVNGGMIGYLDADGVLDDVADSRLEWINKARGAMLQAATGA